MNRFWFFSCCLYWFLKGLNQFRVSYPNDLQFQLQLHSAGALLIPILFVIFGCAGSSLLRGLLSVAVASLVAEHGL